MRSPPEILNQRRSRVLSWADPVCSRVPRSGFDPLGVLTRAFITDVRPKLFDGQWKE